MVRRELDTDLLFNRVAQGDERAYGSLVAQYSDQVYAYCLTFTKQAYYAEELTQEVFIRLWTYRHQLTQVESWDSYLYQVSKNAALRFMQRVAKEQQLRQEVFQHFSSQVTSDEPSNHHWLSQIQRAIQALPQRRRRAFMMSRLDGLTHAEIAAELNISPNTVKEHIVQAKKAIRRYLKVYGNLGFLLVLWRLFQ
ncbi:RNA polymerase sigma factor [Tunicatimonas pelagia]|uniref:RNA polymerase sigma factor n=1 Tax=Tunicatimonas pelagia TaxID=931531 RepID=UPI0026658E63|nr:RNA polymerase sigma-70 factor [Tunicatimonas pelagia]WKN44703.1 RNA polymerase sigma-70 factor [Tunicatimonas pelagia]